MKGSSEAIEVAERAPAGIRDATLRDAAFVRLADEHLDRAYRLARAILRDPAEAQDATHDAFVQAWRRWETLRDPAKFEPWFDRILVNTCRNRMRSNRRQATDISTEVALATGDHSSRAEDREVVGAAIAELSPDHQLVVALRYYRDLTVPEIARRLGVPTGTVQSRLHYALKRLHARHRPGRHQGDRPMTDRDLERRLRDWYAAEVGESEQAPADLRDSLRKIPATTPIPLHTVSRRRGLTLLAAAALLVTTGLVAAGSGIIRLPAVVTPSPSDLAVVPSVSPPPPETPAPTPHLRPGGLIAFTRVMEKPERKCTSFLRNTNCPTLRLWTIDTGGAGAHELQTGSGRQTLVGWSPDGASLVYQDEGKLYVTDTSGRPGQLANTGCVAPCSGDAQVELSFDGRHIVFVRDFADAAGGYIRSAIATMDLASGEVAELSSTSLAGGAAPTLSPDGERIAFYVYGSKPDGGPFPQTLSSIWVVDRDGQNLRQVSATTLAAQSPRWSPDGTRIVFISPRDAPDGSIGDVGFVYTMRPDGSDVRRLTDDGAATEADWTPDGRIQFIGTGRSPGLWTMDADGANAAPLLSAEALGVAVAELGSIQSAWQPLGGTALAPLPWTPATAVAVGPPAPTPSPTPTPDLAAGFSWTGSPASVDGGPLGETATLLADGRVLFAGGCDTKAEVYDPATGTFSPTGSLAQVRAGATATPLHDGRVLFAGGYNCAPGGQDGMWASAEVYDPATGTFGPTGSMAAPRSQHTATLLADGRVLIAGGLSGPAATASGITLASYRTAAVDSFLKTAEIYRPVHGNLQQDGFDEHATSRPYGDPAPGRPRPRHRQRGRDQPLRNHRRCLRPGDRHVQPDRLDEIGPLAPHRDTAPRRSRAHPWRPNAQGFRPRRRRAVRPRIRQVQLGRLHEGGPAAARGDAAAGRSRPDHGWLLE